MLVGVDIGATSIKVGVFDDAGKPVAVATRSNRPHPQEPGGSRGSMIWDAEEIWRQVSDAMREVTAGLPSGDILRAVAVSGFGADGAPFSRAGHRQLYPIISWHDDRAAVQARRIERDLGADHIYEVTGYHAYPINTLNRWAWLAEHAPYALEAATWLMVPDIVAFRLCGEMRTDPTSASTTMAFDLRADDWAPDLLAAAGVSNELPASLAQPGEPIGRVTAVAAEQTGLPVGTLVVVGGHDCEVGALVAAAGMPDDAFVDITGTWEMLLVQLDAFTPDRGQYDRGIDWERHAIGGSYLCESLMPAGSILNWLRDLLYDGASGEGWDALVRDAAAVAPGAGGVAMVPSFVPGMGPYGRIAHSAVVLGLRTTTSRAQLARAAFEALCYQLRHQLEVLESIAGRSCATLRVLGGAQRNDFWLQLKADVTQRRVEAVSVDEATLHGAALLAGVGAGVFGSIAEAQGAIELPVRSFEPNSGALDRYAELYESVFRRLPAATADATRTLAEVGE